MISLTFVLFCISFLMAEALQKRAKDVTLGSIACCIVGVVSIVRCVYLMLTC